MKIIAHACVYNLNGTDLLGEKSTGNRRKMTNKPIF